MFQKKILKNKKTFLRTEIFDSKLSKISAGNLRAKQFLDPPLEKNRKKIDPKLRQMSSIKVFFRFWKF